MHRASERTRAASRVTSSASPGLAMTGTSATALQVSAGKLAKDTRWHWALSNAWYCN